MAAIRIYLIGVIVTGIMSYIYIFHFMDQLYI